MENAKSSLIGILGIIIILATLAFIVWWLQASERNLFGGVTLILLSLFLFASENKTIKSREAHND